MKSKVNYVFALLFFVLAVLGAGCGDGRQDMGATGQTNNGPGVLNQTNNTPGVSEQTNTCKESFELMRCGLSAKNEEKEQFLDTCYGWSEAGQNEYLSCMNNVKQEYCSKIIKAEKNNDMGAFNKALEIIIPCTFKAALK